MPNNDIKVLSIDGGGVRGLIPAKFLAAIETEIGKPLNQVFDVFVGTSSGSISAFGLSTGLFTAKRLPQMFRDTAQQIFPLRRLSRIGARGGFFGPKYQVENLEGVLGEVFGDKRLGELLRPTVAPAFNLASRAPVYFSSTPDVQFSNNPRAITVSDPNLPVASVVRASSAAPIFFRPVDMMLTANPHSAPIPATLVDGGLVSNNPSMFGGILANHLAQQWTQQRAEKTHECHSSSAQAPRRKIRIVSISTDGEARPLDHKRAFSWGLLDWLRPLTAALMQTQHDLTDSALSFLSPDIVFERIGIDWSNAPNKQHVAKFTDNATDRNLSALEDAADWAIEQQRQRLGDLSFRLMA